MNGLLNRQLGLEDSFFFFLLLFFKAKGDLDYV